MAKKMRKVWEKLVYGYGAVPMKWIKDEQSWYVESGHYQQNEQKVSKVGVRVINRTNGMKQNRDGLVCGDLRLPTKWLAKRKSWHIVMVPYQ